MASDDEVVKFQPNDDEKSLGEVRQFENDRSNRLENDILEQKHGFRPQIFQSFLAAVFFFYVMAFIVAICLTYMMIHASGMVPKGGLVLLGILCATPTALMILGMKALFNHGSDHAQDNDPSPSDASAFVRVLKEVVTAYKSGH